MSWTLTTPVAVGDLDPNGPYAEVRIVRQAHDSVSSRIVIDLEYGNTVNGDWVQGLEVRSRPTSIMVQGDEYAALVGSAEPAEGETTYAAVKRGLYEFLLSKDLIGPGALS